MSTSRTIAFALGVLAACLVLSAPVAEGAFRLLGIEPADQTVAVFRPFGDGSYRPSPRAKSLEDWASGKFWIYTDDFGLRCGADGRPAAEPGKPVDLLILGDSQAFGLGLDFERTVVGVMTSEAAKDGRTIANAAVGGHFLRNQVELAQRLHEEGLRFRRVAMLMSSGRVQDPDGYSSARVASDGRLFGQVADASTRAKWWAKTHFATYGVLRNAYRNQFGSMEHGPDTSAAAYRRSNAARFLDGWRAELSSVRDWAKGLGVQMDMVYLPDTFDFDVDALARKLGDAWADVDSDVPFQVLKKACDDVGIGLVDARPPLRVRKDAGLPLHLRTDYHYDADTSRDVGLYVWRELCALRRDGR